MDKFDQQKEYTTNDLARMIFSLSNSFSGFQNNFGSLERKFDVLDNKFSVLENRFDLLENRFSVLEGRFDVLEGRFDGLEGRFDTLENKFDKFQEFTINGFKQLDYKIDFVYKDLKEDLNFKFNGLNSRLDDLANTKADKKELNAVASRVDALETLAVNSQK